MLKFRQFMEAIVPDYNHDYKQGAKKVVKSDKSIGNKVSAIKVGNKIYHGHGRNHHELIPIVTKKVGGNDKFDNHFDSGHIKLGYYNRRNKMFHHYDQIDSKDKVERVMHKSKFITGKD